jgi:5-methylcytosine-specific restriction endonuclease McrA
MVSKRSLRWQEGQSSDGQEIVPEQDLLCPLCGRELIRGDSVDEHHLIPRSQGGRDKYLIHKVCHQKIHQTIKPRELAKAFNTWQALREHPEIDKFIQWVQKRPPEFLG